MLNKLSINKKSIDSCNNDLSYSNKKYKLNKNSFIEEDLKNIKTSLNSKNYCNSKHSNLLNVSNFENRKRTHKFSRRSRYCVYILLSIINIIVNMDSGNILPATELIIRDFNVNNTQLGSFASFVSLGTFVGGIISLSIINIFSRKATLIICNIMIAVLLYTFSVFSNIAILYFNRILVGIFMVNNIF